METVPDVKTVLRRRRALRRRTAPGVLLCSAEPTERKGKAAPISQVAPQLRDLVKSVLLQLPADAADELGRTSDLSLPFPRVFKRKVGQCAVGVPVKYGVRRLRSDPAARQEAHRSWSSCETDILLSAAVRKRHAISAGVWKVSTVASKALRQIAGIAGIRYEDEFDAGEPGRTRHEGLRQAAREPPSSQNQQDRSYRGR